MITEKIIHPDFKNEEYFDKFTPKFLTSPEIYQTNNIYYNRFDVKIKYIVIA